MRRARIRDERGLVGRAAIMLLILIVLGGLAAVDGTAVLFAKLQASDVADAAASAGAANYGNTHSVQQARDAAVIAAREQDAKVRITRFSVATNGTVTVTVQKTASTLIVRHVSFLRHFGVVHDTSSSGP
jgi:Flp pilus assembly protein TadG